MSAVPGRDDAQPEGPPIDRPARPRPVAVYTDTDPMLDVAPARALLEAAGWETRFVGSTDRAAVLEAGRDATAVCVGYAPLDRELLASMPRLAIVATLGVGVDNVDVEAAGDLGIWVANIAGAATDEVASHALAMALALVRHLPLLDRHVREGGWDGGATGPLRRIGGLTLGIVGVGRIGRRMAEYARPLFGRIVGFDPNVATEAWPDGIRRVSLDELVAAADVVSLHLPLDATTAGLFDEARIAAMRPGSWLVNAARGGLVDVPALIEALDRGHLDGAALDVLPTEPPAPDDPALRHPRILLSPHAAFYSNDSAADYVRIQAENVLAWWRTGRPNSTVVEGRR